jgi:hypothetical protein
VLDHASPVLAASVIRSATTGGVAIKPQASRMKDPVHKKQLEDSPASAKSNFGAGLIMHQHAHPNRSL